MRASVVVPSRGGVARLPILLGALSTQTHLDVEVVVVLDGDVDGSRESLEPWVDRIDLKVVEFPENRGRSSALNAGFAAATGDVLIRCDDDLEPSAGHVARHVSHHLGAQEVGVIGLCPNVYPDTSYARVYGRRRDQMFREAALALPEDQRWRMWGANVSARRSTWERVGGYDLAYRAYGLEDVDWGYRVHAAGLRIILDPELDALHHGAASSTQSRALRAYHSGAARETFGAIHGAQVLGSDAPPAGPWGAAVLFLGHRLGEHGVRRLARLTDHVAGRVPRYVGEKLVALSVESSAIAGQATGARRTATF